MGVTGQNDIWLDIFSIDFTKPGPELDFDPARAGQVIIDHLLAEQGA